MEKLEIRMSETILECVENKQAEIVVNALRECLIKEISEKVRKKWAMRINDKEWRYLLNGQKMHFNFLLDQNGETYLRKHGSNVCTIKDLTTSSLARLSDSI